MKPIELCVPCHCEAEGRSNLRLYLYNTFLLIIIFLLFSCTTTKSLSQTDILPPATLEWTELKPGFEITNQKIQELGVSWTCVKIDLTLLEAGPVITTSDKPFSVKDFARQKDLTVAVNTTQFSTDGASVKAEGIIKDKGSILSEPIQKYCALAIFTDENGVLTCSILENQNYSEIEKYDYAAGGFFVILKDEQILEFAQNRRSRTACGTDNTGHILYFFAVTPDFSLTDKNGLSYPECAAIMRELGCTQAMQFDGGHSTSMVINGKPAQTPLFQRKVAAAIGF